MKAAKGSVPQDQGPSVPLQRHKGHNQESESPRGDASENTGLEE